MSSFPSEEYVRNFYCELPYWPQEKTWYPHRAKEFDDWLARHDAQVVKETQRAIRERLLAEWHNPTVAFESEDGSLETMAIHFKNLISFIQGEK